MDEKQEEIEAEEDEEELMEQEVEVWHPGLACVALHRFKYGDNLIHRLALAEDDLTWEGRGSARNRW